MAETVDRPGIDAEVEFSDRGISVPIEYRLVWMLGAMSVLLWRCSHGAKSSVERLEVLDWAVASTRNTDLLLGHLRAGDSEVAMRLSVRGTVRRAVAVLVGEGLAERKGGTRVALTSEGKKWAKDVWEALSPRDLLRVNAERIQKSFTEGAMTSLRRIR